MSTPHEDLAALSRLRRIDAGVYVSLGVVIGLLVAFIAVCAGIWLGGP
jgi:hypothetical protein